jgi:processive 1,2-diacylglycerol beta-glucosyltransferase
MKKILIMTAGFGEGHNTAARNISEALQKDPEVTTRVVDIYTVTHPRVTKVLQKGYLFAINKWPFLWELAFNFLNHPGHLEKTLVMAGPLKRALGKVIGEFQPDVLISTYPLYAFLIHQLREECHPACRVPLTTVITDSTAVNTSWYRLGSDFFVVVDEETAVILKTDQIAAEKIKALGFPVAPRLVDLATQPQPETPPWKILYHPSSKLFPTLQLLQKLRQMPEIEVTVVTGRLEKLHAALVHSPLIDGKKIKLLGWTDQMPELLTSHHLYIGKAGGATVHEAMAAQCPILVSHVVPGQEEGNIELIERLDIGRLSVHYPLNIAASVAEIFGNEATIWHRWKNNLKRLAHPEASQNIANFVLSLISGD